MLLFFILVKILTMIRYSREVQEEFVRISVNKGMDGCKEVKNGERF